MSSLSDNSAFSPSFNVLPSDKDSTTRAPRPVTMRSPAASASPGCSALRWPACSRQAGACNKRTSAGAATTPSTTMRHNSATMMGGMVFLYCLARWLTEGQGRA